jgi:hypothetical protein
MPLHAAVWHELCGKYLYIQTRLNGKTFMNRRKALRNILLLTAASTSVIAVVKLMTPQKAPDLKKLRSHEDLITEMAETIIPATSTPGAKAANVTPFIIAMIEECTPPKQQIRFIEGLDEVNRYARKNFHHPFVSCTSAEKQQIVDHFEKRDRPYKAIAGKISKRLVGDSFFTIMKAYTVNGYCNSMLGSTRGMAYDHVPGKYEGCTTLTQGQRCWATQ